MIFIPLGIDCDVANFLNKYNLRKTSLPFDWNVSYNGVSRCIENNFANFTDFAGNDRINKDDVYFHHDFLEDSMTQADKEKYNRRCERLLTILETGGDNTCDDTSYRSDRSDGRDGCDDILFIRKGHMCYHHEEQNGKYKDIKCDIEDSLSLNRVLQSKYPQLKYKVILVIGCTKCFKKDSVFPDIRDKNVVIYNNVCEAGEAGANRNQLFEECLLNACAGGWRS
jgi:hypothetical protein